MDTKLNIYKVYKHTSPSGKVYIGITSRGEVSRWSNGMGYHNQPYFFKSIVKYGWINFKHEILFENLQKNDAYKIETDLIKEYKSSDINFGYNIHIGGYIDFTIGKSGRVYKKRTEPKKINPKSWRRVVKYDLNKNIINTFENVGLAAKDAGVPIETLRTWCRKNKMPINYKCIYSYEDNLPSDVPLGYRIVAIDRYDISGVYIDSFNSIEDAGRKLNIKTSHIPDVCRGKRIQSCGYKWKYKE